MDRLPVERVKKEEKKKQSEKTKKGFGLEVAIALLKLF